MVKIVGDRHLFFATPWLHFLGILISSLEPMEFIFPLKGIKIRFSEDSNFCKSMNFLKIRLW